MYNAINFSLSTGLPGSYSSVFFFLSSLNSECFLTSSVTSSWTHGLFRCVLFNFKYLRTFWKTFLFSSLISFLSENVLCKFSITLSLFRFLGCLECYLALHFHLKEYGFCCCPVLIFLWRLLYLIFNIDTSNFCSVLPWYTFFPFSYFNLILAL